MKTSTYLSPGQTTIRCYTSSFFPGLLALLAAFATLALPAAAAPPSNDHFANAIVLSGITPVSAVDNTDATNEASDPSVAGFRTTWWTYQPPSNGRLTVSTTNSAGFRASVVVYLGSSLTTLRQIAGASDNGNPATFTFPVTTGTDYRISVGSYFSSTGSSYSGPIVLGLSLDTQADVSALNIPVAATMANDIFAQRVSLTGTLVAGIGYNLTATNEAAASEPSAAGFRTLWWTYRPSVSGRLTLSTTGSDSFRANVVVWLGNSLATLRQAAGSPDNGQPAGFSFPVTANTDYHISIGSYFNSSGSSSNGSIVLGLALDTLADVSGYYLPTQATAANDSFAQQVTLVGPTVSAIGYNTAATREALEPATYERTIWWNWTSPAAGQAIIDLTGSDAISKRVTVWTGGLVSSLAAVATSAAANAPQVTFTATAGQTYRIAVGNTSTNAGGSIVMTIAGPPGQAGSSVPSVTIDSALRVRWFAANGLRYQVQKSLDLSTWTNAGALIVGNGTFKEYYEPIGGPAAYFRVYLQP